jgi:hypothetical protein
MLESQFMRIGTAPWGHDPTASAAGAKNQEPATFMRLTSIEPTVLEP